jgi:hypothetical protein
VRGGWGVKNWSRIGNGYRGKAPGRFFKLRVGGGYFL